MVATEVHVTPPQAVRWGDAALDLLIESPTNPRTAFDEADLAELAASIREQGIVEPLVVRPLPHALPEAPAIRYEIVAGARRYRAAKLAGLTEVPVIVRTYTDDQVLQVQIVENLQREGMAPLDEARAYARLMELGGRLDNGRARLGPQEIADQIGKSVEYVYARLKLLDATPKVQKALADGKLKAEQAVLLARLPEQDQAEGLARCTDSWNPMTVKRLREWVKERDDAAKMRARIAQEIKNAEANGKRVVRITRWASGSPPKGVLSADRYVDAGKAQCPHRALGFYVEDGPKDYEGSHRWVCTNPTACPVHKKAVADKERNARHISATGRSLDEERKRQARAAAQDKAIGLILAKIAKPGVGPTELAVVLDTLIDRVGHDHVKAVCKRRGFAPKKRPHGAPAYDETLRQEADRMKPAERETLLFELALQQHTGLYGAPGRFGQVAKDYGVDVARLEREALAELTAKAKARVTKAVKSATKKAIAAKQTSAKKKAGK